MVSTICAIASLTDIEVVMDEPHRTEQDAYKAPPFQHGPR